MIYIIRHGETDANRRGLLQGRSDFPLNINGVKLAEITGHNMKGIHFDKAYSSPLQRAFETARIVLEESGSSSVPIIIDKRIIEMSFGDCEQMNFRNIAPDSALSATDVSIFFSNPPQDFRFPGGESIREVCIRTQNFLKELAADPDNRTKNILVATHGAALRSMLNFLYDDPDDFWHGHVPYNCAVNIISSENGKCVLTEDDKIYYDSSSIVDLYS